MTGVSHTKAVTTIRKTRGLVHLVVSRPSDQNPNTYLAYLPMNADRCNGNTGTLTDLKDTIQMRSFFLHIDEQMPNDTFFTYLQT